MSNEADTTSSGRKYKESNRGEELEFVRASKLEVGAVYEGIFQGTLPSNLDPAKKDFKILLDNGKLAIINQAGNLARRMEDEKIQVGDAVRITYLGMSEIKKGKLAGKMSHNFKVQPEDKVNAET